MYKYSKNPFEGWKYRAKFEFKVVDNPNLHSIDIYTDNINKEKTDVDIRYLIFNNYKITTYDVKLIHWVSKEQDDLTTKFINSIGLNF